MRVRRAVFCLLLLACVGVGEADGPTPPTPAPRRLTPEQAADAVVAAHAARDTDALRTLATQNAPDPWLVVDELLRRGQHAVGAALAGAAPGADTERLAAYVERRGGQAEDVARRALLARQDVRRDPRALLAAIDELPPLPAGSEPDMPCVRVALLRSYALAGWPRLAEAITAFRAAARDAEQLGWLQGASDAWHQAGVAAYRHGALEEAAELWEARRALCERRGHRGDEAGTLINLGGLRRAQGEYEEAIKLLERGRDVAAAARHREWVANAWGNLGNVQLDLGAYAQALAAFRRTLEEHAALGNVQGQAQAHCGIGTAQAQLGEYAEALATLETALELARRAGGRLQIAAIWSRLASVHSSIGDFPKALALYEQALAEHTALGARSEAARTRAEIGKMHLAAGAYEPAAEALQAALAAQQELQLTSDAASTLANLGGARMQLGDPQGALAAYEQALASFEALGARAGQAGVLGNLGSLHMRGGEHARALDLYTRSNALFEELGNRQGSLLALGNQASACEQLGDLAGALARARRAVELSARLAVRLADEEGARARDQHPLAFEVGLRASAAAGSVEEAAWFLEAGRAGLLRAALGSREALEAAALPEELARALTQARESEQRALVEHQRGAEGRDRARVRTTRAALEVARERLADVEARVQREARMAAGLTIGTPDDLVRMRARLAEGEALVLYGTAHADAFALVVRHSGAQLVKLGVAQELMEAAKALRDDPVQHLVPDAAARLRALAVTPLQLASDVRRVLVCPAGALGYVPFSLLLPGQEVVYVPSGTTYGLLLEQRALRGSGILAFGDPDYGVAVDEGAVARHRGGALRRLPSLPSTRAEVEAVGTSRLLGAQASEAGVPAALAGAARWRAVHFACHGLVDADRAGFSSLALTAGSGQDGFLTVLEILRLRFAADLVVLSACETATGTTYQTEGIVGLTRAFMHAGAPRVLCSLWKVDDEATQALMTKFYQLWAPKDGTPGLSTAQALRQAQEFVRSQERWNHPYYWAAWVLWGLP